MKLSINNPGGSGADEKVKLNSSDTAASYLDDKLTIGYGLTEAEVAGTVGNTTILTWDRLALFDSRRFDINSADPASAPYVTWNGFVSVSVTAGAVASGYNSNGLGIQLTTIPVPGDVAYILADPTFAGFTAREILPVMSDKIETVGIATVRHWHGLFDGSPFGSDNPTGLNLAGFRFSTAASDSNWIACTKDGTTLNTTDTGVAVAANTYYRFIIEMVSGAINFYINGTLVATHTTNLPTSTTPLNFYSGAEYLGGFPPAPSDFIFHSAQFLSK